ncbi:MAG: hypothetical protein AB1646_03525 [Thermodesulfobacteriota bacterium]
MAICHAAEADYDKKSSRQPRISQHSSAERLGAATNNRVDLGRSACSPTCYRNSLRAASVAG